MAANIEEIKFSRMAPGPHGMAQITQEDVVFVAHNEKDIEDAIKAKYFTTSYPVGKEPNDADMASPGEKVHAFWSWGYFKRSLNHDSYKENMADIRDSVMFLSEKYQQLGTSKYFEGALVDARNTFKILDNNYDVKLFVKYSHMTIKEM